MGLNMVRRSQPQRSKVKREWGQWSIFIGWSLIECFCTAVYMTTASILLSSLTCESPTVKNWSEHVCLTQTECVLCVMSSDIDWYSMQRRAAWQRSHAQVYLRYQMAYQGTLASSVLLILGSLSSWKVLKSTWNFSVNLKALESSLK